MRQIAHVLESKRLSECCPLATKVQPGRVIELCGSVGRGRFTMATQFLLVAQHAGESCAWVQQEESGLYPPDLAHAGVRLDDLLVLQTPAREGAVAVAKGAELLLRSGGFGLVVIDLVHGIPRGTSWAARLCGLARHHQVRVVLLTTSNAGEASVGATIAVRAEPQRIQVGVRYMLDVVLLRDRCDLAHALTHTTHDVP
jgi:hypothetical protein